MFAALKRRKGRQPEAETEFEAGQKVESDLSTKKPNVAETAVD